MNRFTDPARPPAGERPGQRRRRRRVDERLPVDRRRTRLVRGQERRPALGRDRAGRQHRRHPGRGHDPAGGDERHVDRGPDQGEQRQQPGVPGRVGERAPVPAGLDPLYAEQVGAGARGGPRLRHRRDRDHHQSSGRPQPRDLRRGRAAERHAHERHPLGHQQVELGRSQPSSSTRGSPSGHAVPGRLGGEGLPVAPHRGEVERRGVGHEQVHAERPPGRGPDRGDVGGDALDGLVAGGERAEPAGRAHRRRQLGGRGLARHRGQQHGVGQQVGKCHPGTVSRTWLPAGGTTGPYGAGASVKT